MKLFIASDLHGSLCYCREMIEAYDREQAERMILLGDLLYHGPRNDLPEEYDPKAVIQILNDHKEAILCVRGNCEAEVDQMVLEFPVLADYMILFLEGRMVFVTHGHHYNENQLPPMKSGDILLHGHTHIKEMRMVGKKEDILYLNPGSLSIPKDDTRHSYMIYENGIFTIKEMDGTEIQSVRI